MARRCGCLAAAALAVALLVAAPAGRAEGLPPEGLPELLRRVLLRDPQVRSAEAQLQVGQQRLRQAMSRMGPTLGLTHTRGPSVDTEYGISVPRRVESTDGVLRWNLYNAGNDLAEWRATEVDLRASVQERRRALEEAAQRIAEVYLDVLRLQTLVEAAAERLRSVERLAQTARRQNELGRLSDADAQQLELALLDAQMVQQEMLADLASARAKLSVVTGADGPQSLPPLIPVSLPAPGVVGDPGGVEAARERAVAARMRVRPEESVLAPRIDLEMRKQLANRTLPVNSTEIDQAWLITLRWDFPVGGEAQSRRDEAARRAEAAAAEAERAARDVLAERSTQEPQARQAGEAVAQLQRQLQQYETLLRASDLQFEAGRRSLWQLVQLRESRYGVAQRLAEQTMRQQRARLAQLALGGELLSALGLPVSPDMVAP